MKKAFVSGGTGFIGQALIRRLGSEGWQVTALARSSQKASNAGLDKVAWCFGDIRAATWHRQVQGSSVFFHLAGVHGFHQISFPERLSIELEGTKNAVIAAEKAKVPHFIYINTAFAGIKTDYGRAKQLAKSWVELKMKKGFPGTIVCPVTVYGPGDRANLYRLFRAVAKARFFFIGKGENIWQLIYIDDLIDALLRLSQKKKAALGKTLILSGESWPLKQLVDLIAQETGVNPAKIHLPPRPMLVAGCFFSFLSHLGLPVPFTSDTILMLTASQNYQVDKLKKTLGLQTQTNLLTGIKKTVKWYQLNLT